MRHLEQVSTYRTVTHQLAQSVTQRNYYYIPAD